MPTKKPRGDPDACGVCGERFGKDSLCPTQHWEAHPESGMVCTVAGCAAKATGEPARSRNASKALSHSHTHTGAKPFPCTQCSKRYTQAGPLTAHITATHGAKEDRQESPGEA